MSKILATFTLILAVGCGTLTPAQKFSINVVNCRYAMYVKEDQKLNDQQKQERLKLVENLNTALKMNCDSSFGR
jgi:uncharacterized membrane protein